ncbi:hypothetical protein HMPREF2976_05735 [Corynebacterium sp. HMSC077D10]|uniref:hypothetical protein n=1 Tax=unclassified Corynebacterium TaxID=2624378 RepID=UPI0008A3296F|nr:MULTISPECIES: hypothetical protein [unclassified Corynebacterium]OFL79806.1 hypothetical protein HMPREF2748_08550 [Corynebacterium sp. HMSC077B05]OFP17779.1 hypothetical protein HMPREF2998_01640 [Corynebacterium sp. HMSC065A05]OFP70626.1 hypothetical protein HMPREF2976_05735 [Corynebacterium sp. HMSC077D10]
MRTSHTALAVGTFVAAALAVTACSSGEESAETSAPASPAPSVHSSAASPTSMALPTDAPAAASVPAEASAPADGGNEGASESPAPAAPLTNPQGAEPTAEGAPTPHILSPAELRGKDIELASGEYLVITGAEGLDATVADPAVAVFSPAYEQDGTQFNAGVGGLTAGTTEVQLSDGTTFSVTVR